MTDKPESVDLSPEEALAVAAAPEAKPETKPEAIALPSSVDELLKVLESTRREVQELKEKVASANRKKEAAFKKKQEASKLVAEKIRELVGSKSERNTLTQGVRDLKRQRDDLNQQIRQKVAEIKVLHEKSKTMMGPATYDRDNHPLALKRNIELIEYKLETQPMGFDAEQKLTKKVKELKAKYDKVKGSTELLGEIHTRSREIDQLKSEANKLHRQVQEHAKNSQEKHEALMSESGEVDELKKQETAIYEEFLKEKQVYLELNQQLKDCIAVLQRVKEELDKHNVKLKEDQKQEEMKSLHERAKEAEQKIKDRKKLTTEDLLAMQGMK